MTVRVDTRRTKARTHHTQQTEGLDRALVLEAKGHNLIARGHVKLAEAALLRATRRPVDGGES